MSSQGPPAVPPPAEVSSEDRQWGMYAHLSGFASSILGPFLILNYLRQKPFVEAHAKEAVNFQLNLLAVYAVGVVLVFVGVGQYLIAAAMLGSLVLAVMAGMKANQGESYQYPIPVRLIK